MPEETENNEEIKEEEQEPEKSEEKEISELEEEVEEVETPPLDLENLEFRQALTPESFENVSAPVLERITENQEPSPRFFGTAPRNATGVSGGDRESEETQYLSSQEQESEEVRYIQYETREVATPERINTQNIGRNFNQLNIPRQNTFFQESTYPKTNKTFQERIMTRPERIDVETVGRKNPIEQEERKYDKYDFKKESSY